MEIHWLPMLMILASIHSNEPQSSLLTVALQLESGMVDSLISRCEYSNHFHFET